MMKKGLFSLAMGLVIAFGAQANAQTAERGGLNWNLKEGDTLHYGFSWKFSQKQEIVGQMELADITVKVSYTLTEKVSAVTDGVASIDATVTSVKAKIDVKQMGMPMGPQAYDSQNDEAGNHLRVIRHVVGKAFKFKLAQNGKITDVSGGEQIRAAVEKAAETELEDLMNGQGGPGGGGMGGGGMGGMGMNPAMLAKMFAGQLTIAFADETLEATLGVVNYVLPDGGQASEGSNWTHDINMKLPRLGSLNYVSKFKHGGTVKDSTRITFAPEGKMTLKREEAKPDPNNPFAGQQRKLLESMEVSRTEMTGTATFGMGHLVDSEVTQEIESSGPLPDQLRMMMGAAEDTKMSMNYGLTLRYELKDGPPAASAPSEAPKGDDTGEKKGASF